MRVKNVSARDIEINDLNLNIGPGEVGDLSSFDPKVLHSHKRLNAMFDKSLLVNLGTAGVKGSRKSLLNARDRINKLGLEGYVPKKSKMSALSNNRKKIADLMKKNDRRAPMAVTPEPVEERYTKDYHYNMYPAEEYVEYEKPRPQIDEHFRPMRVDPNGITSFGENGVIETGLLVPKEPLINKKPKATVSDKSGQEFKVDIDKIAERLMKKCLGTSSSGKPCKKWAVNGFGSCLTHMSQAEKREYESIKQNPKKTAK